MEVVVTFCTIGNVWLTLKLTSIEQWVRTLMLNEELGNLNVDLPLVFLCFLCFSLSLSPSFCISLSLSENKLFRNNFYIFQPGGIFGVTLRRWDFLMHTREPWVLQWEKVQIKIFKSRNFIWLASLEKM